MTVTEKAYAKINLYLEVVGKRPDGYHELVTVMQSISLSDTLTVKRTTGAGIALTNDAGLANDGSNLVCKAAEAYFAATGDPFAVEIALSKRIPMAAGLGGGSADAAAVLRALQKLSNTPLAESTLLQVAARIGADVPFCLVGGARLCRGIGEKMTPLAAPLRGPLVVAVAGEGVSTPAAFRMLDKMHGDFKIPPAGMPVNNLLIAAERSSLPALADSLFNRFEAAVEPLRPAVTSLKKALLREGALAAQMSGSGPSVFGLFEDARTAEKAAAALSAQGVRAYAAEMI